jgi:hypothetical protein
MDEYKKKKISEKISSAALEIIKKEIDPSQEISDRKSMENFYCNLTEILCSPLVQMINETVKMIKYVCNREEDAKKIALLIHERIKSCIKECLSSHEIQSLEAVMGELSGRSVPEIIECRIAMEKMGKDFRIKIPFVTPIPDFKERIQFLFPSFEKPIHIIVYRENMEDFDEYYIEEVENPKFRWIKRNSKEKVVLSEFIVNDINRINTGK